MENTHLKYTALKSQLINLYCSKDNLKKKLMVASDFHNTVNNIDYWCISDGNIAVLIPHELIGNAGVDHLKYEDVFSLLQPLDNPLLFTLNQLKGILATCDSEPGYEKKFKECETCNGNGMCKCSCCLDRHECGNCGGQGEILVSKTPTGRLFYKKHDVLGVDQGVQINGAIFNPNMIERLIHGIELLALSDHIIQLTHSDIKTCSLFLIGEIIFLVMPLNQGSIYKYEIKGVLPLEGVKP